jgi:hypothetical protein
MGRHRSLKGEGLAPFGGYEAQNAQLGVLMHGDTLRAASRPEDSRGGRQPQQRDEGRRCEAMARALAQGALRLGGALAFQQASLSRHYAGRAVALGVGGVR